MKGLGLVLCLVFACASQPTTLGFTQLQFLDKQSHQLKAKFEVALALDVQTQAQGLMYRQHMPASQGMLFIFPENIQTGFWMKNTYISLDMIFMDQQGFVVDIKPNTKPLSEQEITPVKPYRYCLEINAGLVEKFKISIGDKMTIAN